MDLRDVVGREKLKLVAVVILAVSMHAIMPIDNRLLERHEAITKHRQEIDFEGFVVERAGRSEIVPNLAAETRADSVLCQVRVRFNFCERENARL
jgi:hypothetical protein